MHILVAESAETDFTSIRDYFGQRNPVASDLMLARITATAELLATHPRVGHLGRVRGTRELVVTRTPFVLVYTLTEQTLTIVRVLHVRRQWP